MLRQTNCSDRLTMTKEPGWSLSLWSLLQMLVLYMGVHRPMISCTAKDTRTAMGASSRGRPPRSPLYRGASPSLPRRFRTRRSSVILIQENVKWFVLIQENVKWVMLIQKMSSDSSFNPLYSWSIRKFLFPCWFDHLILSYFILSCLILSYLIFYTKSTNRLQNYPGSVRLLHLYWNQTFFLVRKHVTK